MTLSPSLVLLPAGTDHLWRVHADRRLGVLAGEPPLEVPQAGVGAPGAVPNAAGWMAIPVQDGRGVRVFRIDAGRIVQRLFLPVPSGCQVACCVVHGNTLFAGGSAPGDKTWVSETIALLRCDLAAADRMLQPIALPAEVIELRKAVDDLVVIGNELVALDDIVVPKFILRFDLADLPDLRYIGRETFAHGTYESAHRLVAGEGWAAVLSSTVGMGGSSRHVSFWLMPYWRPVAVLSLDRPMFGRESLAPEEWPQIVALGDWLLVESTSRGLGVVNVPDLLERWRRSARLDAKGHRPAIGLEPEIDVIWMESWRGPATGLDENSLLATGPAGLAVLDQSDIRRWVATRPSDRDPPETP